MNQHERRINGGLTKQGCLSVTFQPLSLCLFSAVPCSFPQVSLQPFLFFFPSTWLFFLSNSSAYGMSFLSSFTDSLTSTRVSFASPRSQTQGQIALKAGEEGGKVRGRKYRQGCTGLMKTRSTMSRNRISTLTPFLLPSAKPCKPRKIPQTQDTAIQAIH